MMFSVEETLHLQFQYGGNNTFSRECHILFYHDYHDFKTNGKGWEVELETICKICHFIMFRDV